MELNTAAMEQSETQASDTEPEASTRASLGDLPLVLPLEELSALELGNPSLGKPSLGSPLSELPPLRPLQPMATRTWEES